MNDEIDESAQDDPEWVVWSRPQRIQVAIDRLFTETLPQIPTDWKTRTGSQKPIGPMPGHVDRYSGEMALNWVDDAFDYFFPTEDAPFEVDNAEVVDQFVCYIGEYFVRRCDGRWINDPEMGGVLFSAAGRLHEFGPTIRYDWTDEVDIPMNLLYLSVEQGFVYTTSEWYSRTVDHALVHGIPHEGVDLLREHGMIREEGRGDVQP